MHFLTQIEHHLANFETDARDEIERFLAHLKSKFVEPGAPVPSAPVPSAPVAKLVAPVEPPAAPVVAADPVEPPVAPETPAPVVNYTPNTGAVV